MSSLLIRRCGGAAVILAALLAYGCGAETRYRVLSTIFDGVPPPPGPVVPASDTGAPGSTPQPATPRAKFREHAPYAKRNCGGCHDPGTNKILANPPGLCRTCHVMDLENLRYVHAPVVSGFCLFCHSPHGSYYPWFLKAEPREMCLSCHNPAEIFRNAAHKDQEAPCTDCHNPHADNRYFLKSGLLPLAPS